MKSKDQRQQEFVDLFITLLACGTFEAVTGFGKSRVAIMIIKLLRRVDKTRKVVIIVPKENIQEQWISLLEHEGLLENTRVLIINTAIKANFECSLLILDEIHRYAAESFSKIFERAKYKFILGLTATIKRLDSRHKILAKYCPVIDTVTLEEARENEWIADYQEFNLGIDMDPDDFAKYKKLEEAYEDVLDYFMWDFGLMFKCASSHKPTSYISKETGMPVFVESATSKLARTYGWTGNTSYEALAAIKDKKKNFWGGDMMNHYHPNKVFIMAINGMRRIRSMKSIIYSYHKKVEATIELCKRLEYQTITFGELISTADDVTKGLKSSTRCAVTYHSGLPAITVAGKKLNKKKSKEFILQLIRDAVAQVIDVAKSLDEGADFPGMQLGIRYAGSSSPTQHTQRRGRVIRRLGIKRSAFVNIYIKKTKELQWLLKAQEYSSDVIWTDDIEELIENIKLWMEGS